jgi:hypothetical protein
MVLHEACDWLVIALIGCRCAIVVITVRLFAVDLLNASNLVERSQGCGRASSNWVERSGGGGSLKWGREEEITGSCECGVNVLGC